MALSQNQKGCEGLDKGLSTITMELSPRRKSQSSAWEVGLEVVAFHVRVRSADMRYRQQGMDMTGA